MKPERSLSLIVVAVLALGGGLLPLVAQGPPVVLYAQSFDSLTHGVLPPCPGTSGQDQWCTVGTTPPAFAEIAGGTAIGTGGLHLFTAISNSSGQQTIIRRPQATPNLSTHPIITLHADFYCQTSDQQKVNAYFGSVGLVGGPHPGYAILEFGVTAGNGTAKAGNLAVALSAFDGVNNNFLIPTTVGTQLAWDTWHHVTVIIDQAADQYVSLTVDGQTEALTASQPPRTFGIRGQLIEDLIIQIVPNDFTTGSPPVVHETDDDFFVDNVAVIVSPAGQPNSSNARLEVNGLGAGTGRGPFHVLVPSSGSDAGRLVFDWYGAPGQPLIMVSGSLAPGSIDLGCVGKLDIDLTTLTLLFDGLTPPYTLLFSLDQSGHAQQSFTLPLPLPPGNLLDVQGAIPSFGGCFLTTTASFRIGVGTW